MLSYYLIETDTLAVSLHHFLSSLQPTLRAEEYHPPRKVTFAVQSPQDKLRYHGFEALSLTEILSILLTTTGRQTRSVDRLAQELVTRFGSEKNLFQASLSELMAVKGVGLATALRLQAAFGLRRRTADDCFQALLDSPHAVYDLMRWHYQELQREVLGIVLRDVRGRYLCHEKISLGTMSVVMLHPREIFCPAIRHQADSIIIIHNHPSGDPTPSQTDLDLTRRLFQCSQMLSICLADHLIFGRNGYVSLLEKGFLSQRERY